MIIFCIPLQLEKIGIVKPRDVLNFKLLFCVHNVKELKHKCILINHLLFSVDDFFEI